jgi:hypothetical protein
MIRVWRTAANCGIQWCAIAGTLLWEGGCGPQIPCDLSRTQLSAGGRGHVAKGAEQAYQPAEFVRLKLGLHIAYHRLGGLVEAAQAASAEFWARHGLRHPLGEDFSGAPPERAPIASKRSNVS